MDSEKQKLLVEFLISSADTFAICQGIVDPEYFDPTFSNTIRFIKKYYNEYSATPEPHLIKAETGLDLYKHELKPDEIKYTTNEIEAFCRQRAMERAVLNSVEPIGKGDFGSVERAIKEAMLVSLNRDLGLRYFDDPTKRLDRMLNGNFVEPTGWSEVDDLLFGGISRREMLLVSAGSGGGKSICLTNLGFNFVQRGLDVLYISLELSEDVIAQRFDTMYTGIGRKIWKQHASEIALQIENAKDGKGHLDIKQMPVGTNAATIRSFLKEYNLFYGKMPDLLLLDYLDLMNPNEKIDLGDTWVKDKLTSEQLRNIGVECNMCVATASQLNRSAVKAKEHDHSQIAGGISKINTTDVYWSIQFNEAQRAKNEIAFVMQKTRNSDGVGKVVHLQWDPKHLRILDMNKAQKLNFVPSIKKDKLQGIKESILSEQPSGDGLTDLMSSMR